MTSVMFAGAFQGGSLPTHGAALLEYMAPFYATVRHTGLNAIIAHDFIPDGFVDTYSTDKIRFIHVPLPASMSPYLKRYQALSLLIKHYPIFSHWWLCDIKDVLITKDPSLFIGDRSLVVGEENNTIAANSWYKKSFSKEPYFTFFSKIPDVIYPKTCGVFGGERQVVKELVDQMMVYVGNIKPMFGIDMLLFNFVVYTKFWDQTAACSMQNYYDLDITKPLLVNRPLDCPRWSSEQTDENTGWCKHTYHPHVILQEFYDRHMRETTCQIPRWNEVENITRARWSAWYQEGRKYVPQPQF